MYWAITTREKMLCFSKMTKEGQTMQGNILCSKLEPWKAGNDKMTLNLLK